MNRDQTAANTSLLVSRADDNSARARCTCSGGVIFFPINAPGMGRFKLFDLVGYS